MGKFSTTKKAIFATATLITIGAILAGQWEIISLRTARGAEINEFVTQIDTYMQDGDSSSAASVLIDAGQQNPQIGGEVLHQFRQLQEGQAGELAAYAGQQNEQLVGDITYHFSQIDPTGASNTLMEVATSDHGTGAGLVHQIFQQDENVASNLMLDIGANDQGVGGGVMYEIANTFDDNIAGNLLTDIGIQDGEVAGSIAAGLGFVDENIAADVLTNIGYNDQGFTGELLAGMGFEDEGLAGNVLTGIGLEDGDLAFDLGTQLGFADENIAADVLADIGYGSDGLALDIGTNLGLQDEGVAANLFSQISATDEGLAQDMFQGVAEQDMLQAQNITDNIADTEITDSLWGETESTFLGETSNPDIEPDPYQVDEYSEPHFDDSLGRSPHAVPVEEVGDNVLANIRTMNLNEFLAEETHHIRSLLEKIERDLAWLRHKGQQLDPQQAAESRGQTRQMIDETIQDIQGGGPQPGYYDPDFQEEAAGGSQGDIDNPRYVRNLETHREQFFRQKGESLIKDIADSENSEAGEVPFFQEAVGEQLEKIIERESNIGSFDRYDEVDEGYMTDFNNLKEGNFEALGEEGYQEMLRKIRSPEYGWHKISMHARETFRERLDNAWEREKQELSWNQGFHSQKDDEGNVQTPGLVYRDQLNAALSSPFRQTELADEHGHQVEESTREIPSGPRQDEGLAEMSVDDATGQPSDDFSIDLGDLWTDPGDPDDDDFDLFQFIIDNLDLFEGFFDQEDPEGEPDDDTAGENITFDTPEQIEEQQGDFDEEQLPEPVTMTVPEELRTENHLVEAFARSYLQDVDDHQGNVTDDEIQIWTHSDEEGWVNFRSSGDEERLQSANNLAEEQELYIWAPREAADNGEVYDSESYQITVNFFEEGERDTAPAVTQTFEFNIERN